MPSRTIRSFSLKLIFGASGRLSFRAKKNTNPMRANALTTDGRIPAAKRPPTDIFATTPMMMRSMDGGTSDDAPPAEAKRAVEKSVGYLFLFISGNITDPMAAVFALPDPQIAPKKNVEIVTTIPRPPRIRPKNTSVRSTIRRAIPPYDMIAPAKIKNGMASNVKESNPDINFWGKNIKKSGSKAIYMRPARAEIPRAIPIGTESNRAAKKTINITIPIFFPKACLC